MKVGPNVLESQCRLLRRKDSVEEYNRGFSLA
jgi:hypothetical protein